ncbi:MAG: polysaccharide deacetylase family protein [Thermomicrobiales bacterium]
MAGLGLGRAMKAGCLLVLVAILAAGCVGQSHEKRGDTGYVALDLDPVVPTPPPPPPTSSDVEPGTISVSENSVASRKHLLLEYHPNALGRIPVLMYHAFTSDPALVDEWTRLSSDFRDDLQWLYDHDFHVISMRDLLNRHIDIPAGKHPVVLTFDDASAGQFLFNEDDTGHLVPGPTSAVGIMESFFAGHPDFGHTAHFAIVPNNCFAYDHEFNTKDYCDQKLTWLGEHGYEIGNHTWWPANLAQVPYDTIVKQIGRTALFIDKHVSGDANMSRTLTLPFGQRPDPDLNPDAAALLSDGFVYNGEEITLDAIINVSGGPMFSPFSTKWDAYGISRFNTNRKSLDYWFSEIETGDIALFTSDGDPDTVSIPDSRLSDANGEPDLDRIVAAGKQLITYDPESGSFQRYAGGNATNATLSNARTEIRSDRHADDPWRARSVRFSSTHSGVRNG